MANADPLLLELAALVRGALVLAEENRILGVATDLDAALIKLVALDPTGTIRPQPYELGDEVAALQVERSAARSA